MESWWQGLTILNKSFLVSSVFFSVLSLWQTLSALLGLGGHSHAHMDHGETSGHSHGGLNHSGAHHHIHAGHDHPHHESHSGDRVAFSLVSLRSLIAFGTLFSWAGFLYILGGTDPVWAIAYAIGWGGAAMFASSYAMFKLLNLQETGNVSLHDALGEQGTVYIALPEGGVGQVRVMVGGMLKHVKARSSNGQPLIAGTKVRVTGVDDAHILEVKPLEGEKGD